MISVTHLRSEGKCSGDFLHTNPPHIIRWLDRVTKVCQSSEISDKPRHDSARSIAVTLHDLARIQGGVLWLSDKTIAERSGCSPRMVQRALRMLDDSADVMRLRGEAAYWTSRAYGGRPEEVPTGRHRVLVLSAWRPMLAHTRQEAEQIRCMRTYGRWRPPKPKTERVKPDASNPVQHGALILASLAGERFCSKPGSGGVASAPTSRLSDNAGDWVPDRELLGRLQSATLREGDKEELLAMGWTDARIEGTLRLAKERAKKTAMDAKRSAQRARMKALRGKAAALKTDPATEHVRPPD